MEVWDPWGLYRHCQAESGLTQKIGRSIGQMLADQHTQIVEADAAGWLSQQVPWPEAGGWLRERLPRVSLTGVFQPPHAGFVGVGKALCHDAL